MKKTNIIFWIFTGIFAAFMLFSAITEILNIEDSKKLMNALGYPIYFNLMIGILKVLGVIAIIVPGYPTIKEWAYAGFFFDLFGATYSQIAAFGFKPDVLGMLPFFLFLAISYIYFHKRMNNANPAK